MRAVLDVNVLVSAVLSPRWSPSRLFVAWQSGAFELVVSPALLLAELARAMAYPKLACLVPPANAAAFVAWIARSAVLAPDPEASPQIRSADPNDDYLVALAMAERAVLVSGDGHLPVLADRLPVRTPAAFLASLHEPRP